MAAQEPPMRWPAVRRVPKYRWARWVAKVPKYRWEAPDRGPDELDTRLNSFDLDDYLKALLNNG